MTYPPQPSVSEQVARELHANNVHTKCPPDCLSRWDAAGHEAIAGGFAPPPGYPAPPVSHAPRQSRRRLLLIGAAVLAVVAALVIAGVTLLGGSSAQQMTIKFTLFDASGDGGDCATGGSGGYNDIDPGMPITVKDETGKILASTALPATGEDAGHGMGCTWTMQVLVPNDAHQYSVEAGRRGAVTYSHEQMVAKHWTVETEIS